jgi:hypothetical protein
MALNLLLFYRYQPAAALSLYASAQPSPPIDRIIDVAQIAHRPSFLIIIHHPLL